MITIIDGKTETPIATAEIDVDAETVTTTTLPDETDAHSQERAPLPAIPIPTPQAEPVKRRPGRPPGSKNKPKDGSAPVAHDTPRTPQRITSDNLASRQSEAEIKKAAAELAKAKKAEACTALLVATFDTVAARAGDHWKLKEEEAAMMADPLSEILPDFEDPYMRLAFASVFVLGPKILAHAAIVQSQRKDAA